MKSNILPPLLRVPSILADIVEPIELVQPGERRQKNLNEMLTFTSQTPHQLQTPSRLNKVAGFVLITSRLSGLAVYWLVTCFKTGFVTALGRFALTK